MLLYFYGGLEPAINVDVEDSSLYLMLDPETNDLAGIHIQAFMKRFLPEHPHCQAIDATRWLSPDEHDKRGLSNEDVALQKSPAEMVVGSLVLEYGLHAA